MDGEDSLLAALEDDDYLDGDLGDVDMIDAEPLDIDCGDGDLSETTEHAVVENGGEGKDVKAAEHSCGGGFGGANKARRKKKRKRKNHRGKVGESDGSFTSINRFVFDTCRQLKEKKQYLVWSAVSCLGVSAISDLVKEVDAIQACGGQQTTDGTRPRTSGGILWNILKTREPKAYKEIMAKGREFERQFRPGKIQKPMKDNDDVDSQRNNSSTDETKQPSYISYEDKEPVRMQPNTDRPSALNRIRKPVSYDDLFEEGEIH